jgi:uncharacterized protein (DUF1800 family)
MSFRFLTPCEFDGSHPFSSREAAHLLRRAGFGANPDEVDAAVARGVEETVELLFDEAPEVEQEFQRTFNAISGRLLNAGDPGVAQAWWVFRMLTTGVPLREKLTLFWHGHFATSVNKVESTQLMMQQIDALRERAWGSFRDLVMAVAKEPAMLIWLDGQSNTKAHPNENFARELLELFTCGIGNYTEQDVIEAARAFTGWHREGNKFVFNAAEHDDGPKKFLGRRGRFDGGDVIDLLMAQPATSRFVAGKLLRFFAAARPSDEVIAEAGVLFDQTQLNVKLFLKELFLSKYFYSDECIRARIASPVEFVVGIARTLGIRQPASELAGQLSSMGQNLLAPPNVKGWDGEEKWINATTLAVRVDYARSVPELNSGGSSYAPHCPIETIVPPELSTPEAVVDRLAHVLLQGDLTEETRAALVEFVVRNEEGPQPDAFRDDAGFRELKVRRLLGVMLSLPEFQAY